MKILLCSHVFAPSIGGIETVSRILAGQLSRLGATVTVVTETPGNPISSPYEIVRRPSLRKLRELAREADIILQCNISLRTLFPVLFLRKPTIIAHHAWLTRSNGKRGLKDFLKLAILGRFRNIAISEALASDLPVKSVVIGNPFESDEFVDCGESGRTRDIVFMGRLVSEKGCDLVLRALAVLKTEGVLPTFSVIGDGPELPALKQMTAELGLMEQVRFRGILREGRGEEVAQHRIMVIPSTCKECLPMVALEGIAAGCVVVASSVGGLPEAVGPCGILFPAGDIDALISTLRELLGNATLRKKLKGERSHHLERFQPEIVAGQYMTVFKDALRS